MNLQEAGQVHMAESDQVTVGLTEVEPYVSYD